MNLSYAQNLEDYHLDLLFADAAYGVYVDVGGGHPVADNVTYHFYLKGWSGLVVEPQAPMADLYAAIRPRDVLVRDLVGAREGQATFYTVERLHGLSTTLQAHADGAAQFGADYRTETRAMTTLARLAEQHGLADIDILKIDVEGAEAEVIDGTDFARLRPKVVVVEATVPGTDVPAWDASEARLLALGYRFALFDGLNRFYLAPDQAHRADRLPTTPVSDTVVPRLGRFGRAHEDPRHPDHALARALPADALPLLSRMDLARLAPLVAGLVAPSTDLSGDAFGAVRGRISAHYDGGLIV
jgi:FkbM family methyltransferase